MGRRIQKTFSVWDADNTAFEAEYSKLFLYDGWNLVAERTTEDNSTTTQTYLWGLDLSGTPQGAGGVGGLLAVTDTSGSTFFPTYDGNANVMGYFNADGASVAEYDYGPFGEPVKATGPKANESPFRFSTKYTDPESGQLYYGYRLYDPPSGKWLSRDPIGELGGLNLYAIAGNDPVNTWDMLGMIWNQKLAAKIRGTLESRLTLLFTLVLSWALDGNDLYVYQDDLDEMSPYLDPQIGKALVKYASDNRLTGDITVSDLGLVAYRPDGGNFEYRRDNENRYGTGWWLNGANPDVYVSGSFCYDNTRSKIIVDDIDLVWADRVDPNENSGSDFERYLAESHGESNVWFNIEIKWNISSKEL